MAKRRRKKPAPKIFGQGFVLVDVDNPFFNRSHAESSSNPSRISAPKNIKDDPIEFYFHNRKSISLHQYQSAAHFRRLYERTAGSSLKAMDTTKEPVDGGLGASDGLTQGRMDSAKELATVHEKLGRNGYELVEQVCGQLYFVSSLYPTNYQQKKAKKHLDDCLDTLALMWGYKSKPRFRR